MAVTQRHIRLMHHPVSLGGLAPRVQAEIFTVYDPNTGRTDYRYVARLTRSK